MQPCNTSEILNLNVYVVWKLCFWAWVCLLNFGVCLVVWAACAVPVPCLWYFALLPHRCCTHTSCWSVTWCCRCPAAQEETSLCQFMYWGKTHLVRGLWVIHYLWCVKLASLVLHRIERECTFQWKVNKRADTNGQDVLHLLPLALWCEILLSFICSVLLENIQILLMKCQIILIIKIMIILIVKSDMCI